MEHQPLDEIWTRKPKPYVSIFCPRANALFPLSDEFSLILNPTESNSTKVADTLPRSAAEGHFWIQPYISVPALELLSRAVSSVRGYHHCSVGPTTERNPRGRQKKVPYVIVP